jgi:hypothetical protein
MEKTLSQQVRFVPDPLLKPIAQRCVDCMFLDGRTCTMGVVHHKDGSSSHLNTVDPYWPACVAFSSAVPA